MLVPLDAMRLECADRAWLAALMLAGLVLRWANFSGFGLGDDVIFRGQIAYLFANGSVPPDNGAYRFMWWLPTALSCRLLGITELGLILPITLASTLGIGLAYVLGHTLWGRAGGVIAAALLVVHPLDVAWATMITNDVIVSVAFGATMLCALRALRAPDPAARRRLWALTGVGLWLSFHAKVSAVALVPAITLLCLAERDRVDATIRTGIATAASLYAGTALVSLALTGDPLGPVHAELHFQGLDGAAARGLQLTAPQFWTFVRWLFLPDRQGDLLFGTAPHTLVALAVLGPFLGLRSSLAVAGWLACVFLVMQLNIQRVGGMWVSGFRNIRHMHVFVYPLLVLLAGWLVGLRARWPRTGAVLIAGLLAVGAWQSVTTASRTRLAFRDRRDAAALLVTLPPGQIASDMHVHTWMTILDLRDPRWTWRELDPVDKAIRRAEIAALGTGYLVTGGAREPYFGCVDCIPRADEVDPAQWRLVRELPGAAKATWWRPEPLRVWASRN